MKNFKHFFLPVIIVALILSACGSESDEGTTSLEGASDETDQSEVADNQSDDTADSSEEASDGVNASNDLIIYTVNENLYAWDVNETAEPTLIASEVDERNLYWTPSGDNLIFASWDGNAILLNKLNFASLETQQLLQIGTSRGRRDETNWFAGNWSPNGEWFVINAWSMGVSGVATINGGELIDVGDTSGLDLWTADNRFIKVDINFSRSDETMIEEVAIIDLEENTRTDITDEINRSAAVNTDEQFVRGDLVAQEIERAGYDLADGFFAGDAVEDNASLQINQPEGLFNNNNRSPMYCDEWSIAEVDPIDQQNNEIIYQTDSVAILTDLAVLENGDFTFLRITYPDCEYSVPVGELVYVNRETGEETVIADTLASALDTNQAFNGWINETRAIASPDSSQIVWYSYNENGSQKEVFITDLTTMETSPFMVDDTQLTDVVRFLWLTRNA